MQDLVTEPVTFAESTPAEQKTANLSKEKTAEVSIHTPPKQDYVSPNVYDTANVADYYETETPPPDYDEYYSNRPARQQSPAYQPQLQARPQTNNGRYLMPPAHKAIALLLSHPSLAAEEQNHESWIQDGEVDLQMFGRLLKVLHERPHYNLSHLIGYWRGVYGAEDTERLAKIAGNDLLQAANALTQARQDKPAKADYDTVAAFNGCLETLRRQQIEKISANSLEKLKNADFTQLTKEERHKLALDVLAKKTPRSP